MHLSCSAIALVASLLVKHVLAGVHGRHLLHHNINKRDVLTVVDDVYITETSTLWVTVEWDGVNFHTQTPTPTLTPTPTPTPIPTPDPSSALAQVKLPVNSLSAESPSVSPDPTSTSTLAPPPTTFATVVVVPSPASTEVIPSPATIEILTSPAVVEFVPSQSPSPTLEAPVGVSLTSIIPSPAPTQDVSTTVGQGSILPAVGKRGLAYNNAQLVSAVIHGSTTVSWAYNWGSTSALIPSELEYVPMLWGLGNDHTGNWVSAANSAISSGSTHLLAFNEPDHAGQSNIDPATCAQGYLQHMQPFAGRAKLGAPAVTNGGGAMGLSYLKSFLDACQECTIDFVPIHWYDDHSNVEYFKKHIQDAHDVAGGRPIWITEFRATGSEAEQAAFLKDVIPWLESTGYVDRYAYFYVDGILMQSTIIKNAFLSAVA